MDLRESAAGIAHIANRDGVVACHQRGRTYPIKHAITEEQAERLVTCAKCRKIFGLTGRNQSDGPPRMAADLPSRKRGA